MKIFIYWNRIDNDSKKIYKFLKKDSFREELESKNEVYYHEPYISFQIDKSILEKIASSDVVMFFTHGEEDAILKSKYIQQDQKKNFSFIDFENASILAKKKVIAICCDSAKVLGRYCVDTDIKSDFYIGFQDGIIYDDGAHKNVRGLIYDSYSDAFEKTILLSLHSKCNAQQFVQYLIKSINDMMTNKILNETDDRTLGSLGTITFHRQSAASLIALGNVCSPVFC